MAEGPEVSIIIPHYNDPAGLGRCLDALESQTFDIKRAEVVVGDNASPCGLEAVEQAVKGRARIAVQPEKGAGAARNAAVAASTAPLLAFVDSDCVPEPGWLAAGLECLRNAAPVIGGAMIVSVEDERAMTPVEAFERVFAFDNRTYVEVKQFTVTANLFTTRAIFDQVGGFRPEVSEDMDWCWRARDAGYSIAYCPDAVVTHPARRDWDELIRKWRRLTSEMLAIHRARGGGTVSWLGRSWLMPLSAIAHMPKVAAARDVPRWCDKLGAAAILLRLRIWRLVENHRALMKAAR